MADQRTTITMLGMTVTVTETSLEGDRPGREITAQAGQTVVRLRHTFGAADGPRPEVTVEQLQADLHAARQRAATEAAWREDVRIKVEQLR
jgi:hypothetical protein